MQSLATALHPKQKSSILVPHQLPIASFAPVDIGSEFLALNYPLIAWLEFSGGVRWQELDGDIGERQVSWASKVVIKN